MRNAEIATLAKQYVAAYPDLAQARQDGFRLLSQSYAASRGQELAEAIALSLAVDQFLADPVLDVSKLSGSVLEAFHAQYPHVDLAALDGAYSEALTGYANGWKGKLFEILVRDELNAGERVGDWQLEPGQTAVLADSPTQPGWDLEIQDAHGHAVDVVQLKATESVSYVHEALERYPDIPIVTTDDVTHGFTHAEDVSSAGMSVNDLQDQLPVGDATNSVLDGASHFALPASVVLLTEGYAIFSGKKTVEQAVESAGERLLDSAIAGSVGVAVGTLTFGFGGALAALATRLYLRKLRRISNPRAPNTSDLPLKPEQPAGGRMQMSGLQPRLPVPRLMRRSEFCKSLSYLRDVYAPPQELASSACCDSSSHRVRRWLMRKAVNRVVIDEDVQDPRSAFIWAYVPLHQRMTPYPRSRWPTMASVLSDSENGLEIEAYLSWRQRNGESFRRHLETTLASKTPTAYPQGPKR